MAYQREQDALEQQRWEQEFAYQKQQDAIANAQRWASVNSSSNSSSGTTLTNGNSNSTNSLSDNSLVKPKLATPVGLSSKAETWAVANIFNKNNNQSGISIANLETLLSNALNNNTITESEASRILDFLGL